MGSWGGREATRLTRATLERYGDTCHLCGRAGATTADHLLPRSKGGDNSLENLRPAHGQCNSRRGNMSIVEYNKRYGRMTRRARPSRSW
ncbi:HNH endonuclease [Corynebacterium amycolatum]|nr:HNH endonuclease [Corynebacterium amycolatum]